MSNKKLHADVSLVRMVKFANPKFSMSHAFSRLPQNDYLQIQLEKAKLSEGKKKCAYCRSSAVESFEIV